MRGRKGVFVVTRILNNFLSQREAYTAYQYNLGI